MLLQFCFILFPVYSFEYFYIIGLCSFLNQNMKNLNLTDPAIATSPSEDEEDNAEFYDAQESDTFTLTIPGVPMSNSISHTRDRTDSQGSDDGSSSEGDQTPLPVSDATGADSFLIVTDSTAAQTLSSVRGTDSLDSVSKLQKVNLLSYIFLLVDVTCIKSYIFCT